MTNKKVFTFDMDGTILSSKGHILPETIDALHAAVNKGHIAVLCSGRPYFDMINYADEAKCFDYLICNNGAYFYDMKNKKFHISKEVSKRVSKEFLALGREHEVLFAIHTDKGVYRSKLFTTAPQWAESEIKTEWHKFFLTDESELDAIIDREKVTQVSIRVTKEMIPMLMKYAPKFSNEADVHVAGEVYIDVNPKDTSKLTGIEDLAKFIGMSAKDFISFGDSGNDLQMLWGSGLGIAMANATPEAKEAAHITLSGDNNSNAIAKKIYELIN